MGRAPRTRLAVASVAALATLALGACGGDDDDTEPVATDGSVETGAGDETATTTISSTATASDPDDTTDDTTSSTSGGEVGTREDYVEATIDEVEIEDEGVRTCVAEAIVNEEVFAAIEEQGLTVEAFAEDGPRDLGIDEGQAAAMAEDMAACGDLVTAVAQAEDDVECVTSILDNDLWASFLAANLFNLPPSPEARASIAAVEACLDAATTTTTG